MKRKLVIDNSNIYYEPESNKKLKTNLNIIYSKENHIYFYTNITQKNINNLKNEINKTINQLTQTVNNLMILGFSIHYPPIILHIASNGGNILSVLDFINYIKQLKSTYNFLFFHSIIEEDSASSAILISIICDKRFINNHVQISMYELTSRTWGKFENFNKKISLENLIACIKKICKEHSKIPNDELNNICKYQKIWNAKLCLDYGIVDTINN